MISRIRAKRLVAQILLVVGALVVLGLLLGAAKIVLRSSSGADSASAFHEVAVVPADADQLVSWLPDTWKRQRLMEPATRALIESAYVRAWAAMGHFESTGDSTALLDTFSGPARADALALPRGDHTASWDLGQSLQLEFYALDGATVAIHDANATLARIATDGKTETVALSHETFDVVMVLEDGYWRIRQLRRGPDADLVTVNSNAAGDTLLTGHHPATALPVPALNATEYRPVSWTRAGLSTAATDFEHARALGITALLVPLNFTQLGGSAPSVTTLNNVRMLIDLARQHHLQLIFQLFDGVTDFAPDNWAAADNHLRAMVSAARNQVVLWDLADQPEKRTSGGATATEIKAFLVHESSLLRSLQPTVPQTISWGTAADAVDPALASLVDIVSLHPDTDASAVAGLVHTVQAAIGNRPVMLDYPGPASDGGWGPFPRTEAKQAAAIADALRAAKQARLTHTAVAALQDSTVDGQRGLLRADYSAKPAALLLAGDADLEGVSRPGLLSNLTGRFWKALGIVVVLAVLLYLRFRLERRKSRRVVSLDSD